MAQKARGVDRQGKNAAMDQLVVDLSVLEQIEVITFLMGKR
ncbi:MAG TPA: hypothetical protein VJM77_06575 [Nitrospiria bacterium]|nr:hypothetical protein [Nitrospiria bacterium]